MILSLLRGLCGVFDVPFWIYKFVMGVKIDHEKFIVRNPIIIVAQTNSSWWDKFIINCAHSVYSANEKKRMRIFNMKDVNYEFVHFSDEIIYVVVPYSSIPSVYDKLVSGKKQDVVILDMNVYSKFSINTLTNKDILFGKYPYSLSVSLNANIEDMNIEFNVEDDFVNVPVCFLLCLVSYYAFMCIAEGCNILFILFLYEIILEYEIMNRHEMLNQSSIICSIIYSLLFSKSTNLHSLVLVNSLLDIVNAIFK